MSASDAGSMETNSSGHKRSRYTSMILPTIRFLRVRVWDQIISDVLRLATAIQHCGLGSGYILLFGELRQDPRDQRVAHFPAENINEAVMVKTDALQSATVMDAGFFEELMHPREATPHAVELQLLACDSSRAVGFWLWQIDLPAGVR